MAFLPTRIAHVKLPKYKGNWCISCRPKTHIIWEFWDYWIFGSCKFINVFKKQRVLILSVLKRFRALKISNWEGFRILFSDGLILTTTALLHDNHYTRCKLHSFTYIRFKNGLVEDNILIYDATTNMLIEWIFNNM